MSEYAATDVPHRYRSAAPIPIDNAFLQILLHGGLLLLGGVVFYYLQAWRLLYRKANEERSVFCLAAAAVFSTTPILSMINDLPIPMFALFAIATMIVRENPDIQCIRSRPVQAGPLFAPVVARPDEMVGAWECD